MNEPFPTNWRTAVVLMPHPDDPEFGAAAVAKWTTAGKTKAPTSKPSTTSSTWPFHATVDRIGDDQPRYQAP